MVRFIYLCVAIVALSFFVVPAYFGVSKEHKNLTASTGTDTTADALSFEEIYAIADEGPADPNSLNSIEPAAGEDEFSNGFTGAEDSALEDEPEEIIEPEPETDQDS